ncbi:spore germination protein [Desmospora profundinema]|uniref:Spore germination protein KA n=1 Tax=Desmospora profundinema TaxID=1571184 RepID=A0ABU1IKA1_9BACL|nr:spore germination protein [Desmospora profundinema]MDR6225212.1 spore germination protein KA [Desmospora profundinema]
MGYNRRRPRRNKKRGPTERSSRSQGKDRLSHDLPRNLEKVKQEMIAFDDLVLRELKWGEKDPVAVSIAYMDGLVNRDQINDYIVQPLLEEPGKRFSDWMEEDALGWLQESVLTATEVTRASDWNGVILPLLSGKTVVLLDGWDEALVCNTEGGEVRDIAESLAQATRGPRDSFNESIRTNTSLVRRRIKSPNLCLETIRIGKVTQTDVAIMYIRGIANPKIVEEVRTRLNQIEIDGILETGYIEELIEDRSYTPFPTIGNTERPDTVAANLLEGRVTIFVDGTPYVLMLPTTFLQYFQTAEDYYQRFDISSFLRMLRLGTYFIAILGPSIYIALTTFHHEMIPSTLLISLAAQREGVPFPAVVEALIMEITFEILREAGLRMPRYVGPAVSVVGAIVLGQAVVEAGLISPVMVIVVSATAIASFAVPSIPIQISARLLRFLFMMTAASFGFFGMMLSLIAMFAHMTALRSFGVPYLSPFAPFILADQKDAVFRFPRWMEKERPEWVGGKSTRVGENMQPSPPPSGETGG